MYKGLARQLVKSRNRVPAALPETPEARLPPDIQPPDSWPREREDPIDQKVPVVPEISDETREERRGHKGGLHRRVLSVSLTPEESLALRNFVRAKNMSFSSWARRVLVGELRKELGEDD